MEGREPKIAFIAVINKKVKSHKFSYHLKLSNRTHPY